jgi:cell division protein FtsW
MRIRKTLWTNDAEPVIVIMAVLVVLGTLNVFSSSFVMATVDYDNPYYFLIRHLVMLGIGLFAFFFCRRFNYKRWRYLMPGMVITIIIMLVAVLLVGTEVNGARRWLSVGGVGFQPAEFAKLISLLLMAAYLSSCVKSGRRPDVLSLQAIIILLMAGLTELEPDMGTALIIGGVPFLMLLTAGVGKKIVPWISVGAMGLVGLIFLQPYRLERIKVMFDPWADAQGKGYQTVQSLSTIGSGGFFGMGLGSGVSKYDYLPEAHTDFAFAIFCQEHGFVGAILIFILLALLLFYCIRIANKAADEFGQMLSLGIMLLILGQGIANVAMVGGLLPVVGVPLPFISYGGSSLIVSLCAMGILLNVCDNSARSAQERGTPVEKPKKEEKAELHLVK